MQKGPVCMNNIPPNVYYSIGDCNDSCNSYSSKIGDCNTSTDGSTSTSMYASNTSGGSISFGLGGGASNISLPNNQNINKFSVDPTNTSFIVLESGRYYITYQVNTTASLGVGAGTRILRNGAAIPGTILTPALGTSTYNNDCIASLNAGDTLSLQLFSTILLVATLLSANGSVGAALTIIKLQ